MTDHDLIVQNYTAERYALGELTDTERDDYEEHYFGCTLCAEDVLCSSDFMHYAREVLTDPREAGFPGDPVRPGPVATHQPWFRPMAAAACGLLALGLSVGIYQNLRSQSAHINSAPFTVALTEARAAAEEIPEVPANQEGRLKVPIPPGNYKAYRLMVVGNYDGEMVTGMIKAEAIRQPAELFLPEHRLKPGKYAVVVNGIKEDSTLDKDKEHARFPFRVVDKIDQKN